MLSRDELIALACDDSALEELLKKEKAELEAMLGAGFAAMKDYDQNNPHHCYDLLTHTVKTATGIKKEKCPDDGTFEDLRVAALFHDIGKPDVMTFDEKAGVSRYRHHAEKSAEIAQIILPETGIEENRLIRILFYIRNHDVFMSLKLEKENPANGQPVICPETVRKAMVKASGGEAGTELFIRMITLCIADAQAQSEVVYDKDGSIKDSRELKTERMNEIREALEVLKNEQPE